MNSAVLRCFTSRASNLTSKLRPDNLLVTGKSSVRYKRAFLGLRDPDEVKSLSAQLEEEVAKDNLPPVDIGLPHVRSTRRRTIEKPNTKSKVESSDISAIEERWVEESSCQHIFQAAQHYQIFDHLFDDAFFHPRVPLMIEYVTDDACQPVHRGNVTQPQDMQSAPVVAWPSSDESDWLLVMTALDGNLYNNQSEVIHWAVGNIRGSELSSGQEVVPYMSPLPVSGAGYHRYAFVLYKQHKHIDFSDWPKVNSLKSRTFSTREMYSGRQEELTPAGLAFCQACWDPSVRKYFHQVLDEAEPIYTYDEPEQYRPPQERIPHKHPFDIYLNMYRDRKDIGEQVLKEKLAEIHPLAGKGEEKPRYPALDWLPQSMPTWLQDQKRDRMHKRGIYVLEKHLE